MGQRGRQSSASMIVISREFPVRPKPPSSLTPMQRKTWQEVVNSEPPATFRTAALRALLANLCRHLDTATMLSRQIEGFDPDWLKLEEGLDRFDRLLALRNREARSGADIATKLRLTAQSRYTPQKAGVTARKAGVKPPWDDGEGETADDTSHNQGGGDG